MFSFTGADVQKKWKNLKDTYFKEVATDKKVVSGQATKKKKRPYIHMRALSFLATQKTFRDTTNNIRDSGSTNSNAGDFSNLTDEDTDTEATQNRRLKASMRKKNRNQNNSDDEILKLLQEKKYDEDVSFCEMIIPMLKNLSIEQKHYAKIEILNALNRATKYSPENFIPPRASSTLSQYRSSPSSHSSYNPNTPSPCPNTIRQSPSPQISSYNPTIISQSTPNPSPQTHYTPSRNPAVISQSQPDVSPQTRYKPSRNPTVISQSPPDPSSTQYALSLNSNFPNTSFSHSSYVVEGSGFDMKDYVLFK